MELALPRLAADGRLIAALTVGLPCRIVVGSWKAYFGRMVTMSRNRARTTSSRMLSS